MPPGRPRSETARLAILEATLVEFTERGYDKLSIDGVAARAGVAKQTIYRWYASKNALIADCLMQGVAMAPAVAVGKRGTARADIARWMTKFMKATRDPQVRALIRAASAASAEDLEISRGFQSQLRTMTRLGISTRLQQGIDAGEIRPDTDIQMVTEIIVGSLLYRLGTREHLTPDFVSELARTVFGGIETAEATR